MIIRILLAFFIFSSPCFAGSLQQMHKSVIASLSSGAPATVKLGRYVDDDFSEATAQSNAAIRAIKATASQSFTLTTGGFGANTNSAVDTYLLVYADNAGSAGALIAQSDLSTSLSTGWNGYVFSGANQISIVSSTVYWIAIMGDGTNIPYYYVDVASTEAESQATYTWPTAPDPLGGADYTRGYYMYISNGG